MSSQKNSPIHCIRSVLLNGVYLLGLVFSVILTQHYYDIRNGTAGFRSFCNFGQTLNCDVVTASPYSELFSGLPLSSFSAGGFLALFFISLFLYKREWRTEVARVLTGLSLFSVLVGMYYFFIMSFQLHTYCLFCLGIDAVSWLALALSVSLDPKGIFKAPMQVREWKLFGGMTLASVIVAVVILRGMDQTTSFSKSDVSEAVQNILSSPKVNLSEEGAMTLHPSVGPVTILEFSDFQCPFCRIGAMELNSVANRYPNQIKILFRNFPLDSSCNPQVPTTMHPYACEAAKVAYCAQKQGKFEDVYRTLFENQVAFGPGKPLELAVRAGANRELLQSCLASPEPALAIFRDISEATQLGVKATPIFYVNGHKIEGVVPTAVWNDLLDRILTGLPKDTKDTKDTKNASQVN